MSDTNKIYEILEYYKEFDQGILSKTQRDTLNRFMTNENDECHSIFITGGAGTGKTHLTKSIIKAVLNQRYNLNQLSVDDVMKTIGEEQKGFPGLSILIMSTTGISAQTINGETIYFTLRYIKPNGSVDDNLVAMESLENRMKLKYAEILVIDEISMMNKFIFENISEAVSRVMQKVYRNDPDMLSKIKDKPFGGKRLILVGDFLQAFIESNYNLELGMSSVHLEPSSESEKEIMKTMGISDLSKNVYQMLGTSMCFASPLWNKIVKNNFFYLKDPYRTKDQLFFTMLQKIRTGKMSVPLKVIFFRITYQPHINEIEITEYNMRYPSDPYTVLFFKNEDVQNFNHNYINQIVLKSEETDQPINIETISAEVGSKPQEQQRLLTEYISSSRNPVIKPVEQISKSLISSTIDKYKDYLSIIQENRIYEHLQLFLGSSIIFIKNIKVNKRNSLETKRVYNSEKGIIREFRYDPNHPYRVRSIIVELIDVSRNTLQEYLREELSLSEEHMSSSQQNFDGFFESQKQGQPSLSVQSEASVNSSFVEIERVSFERCNYVYGVWTKFVVSQFPFVPSYAMTIHKSQSLTLKKVAVAFQNLNQAKALGYVALSRVPKIHNLIVFKMAPLYEPAPPVFNMDDLDTSLDYKKLLKDLDLKVDENAVAFYEMLDISLPAQEMAQIENRNKIFTVSRPLSYLSSDEALQVSLNKIKEMKTALESRKMTKQTVTPMEPQETQPEQRNLKEKEKIVEEESQESDLSLEDARIYWLGLYHTLSFYLNQFFENAYWGPIREDVLEEYQLILSRFLECLMLFEHPLKDIKIIYDRTKESIEDLQMTQSTLILDKKKYDHNASIKMLRLKEHLLEIMFTNLRTNQTLSTNKLKQIQSYFTENINKLREDEDKISIINRILYNTFKDLMEMAFEGYETLFGIQPTVSTTFDRPEKRMRIEIDIEATLLPLIKKMQDIMNYFHLLYPKVNKPQMIKDFYTVLLEMLSSKISSLNQEDRYTDLRANLEKFKELISLPLESQDVSFFVTELKEKIRYFQTEVEYLQDYLKNFSINKD